MSLETLPAVHLDHGRFPEYPDADPSEALGRLAERFGRVVIIDVEGVRRNNADLEFIQEHGRKRTLWVDAGSRYTTDVMDLFIAGAETVTMRWNTLASTDEFEEAAALARPGGLLLGLEFPGGVFLKHPKDGRDAHAAHAMASQFDIDVVHIVDEAGAAKVREIPATTGTRWLQGVDPARSPEWQGLGYHGILVEPQHVRLGE